MCGSIKINRPEVDGVRASFDASASDMGEALERASSSSGALAAAWDGAGSGPVKEAASCANDSLAKVKGMVAIASGQLRQAADELFDVDSELSGLF